MTADVVLTLGLEAGSAEAGARVIRRALDQVGAAATAAVGQVQGLGRSLAGLSADRPVAELKRIERSARDVGAAQAGMARSAGDALRDSLDLGRRLSGHVRDLLRDQTAIRDAVRRTGSDLSAARRATDDMARGARSVGDGLSAGFDKGKASITGFIEHAKRSIRQFSTRLVIETVFHPTLGKSFGGFAGNILSYFAGGARGGAVFDLNSLVFGGKGQRKDGETPPLSFLQNAFSGPSQWLADALPALFGPALPTSAAVFASPLLGAGGLLAGGGAASLATIPSAAGGLFAGLSPLLPLAAVALPFILNGLFSKKPSVGPNANATIGALADGRLGIVGQGADNGGDVDAAIELAETSIKALTRTLRQIGATLGDATSIRGLQVGHFKNKYFVDDTALGGTARYDQNQFEDAAAAVADFVRRALNRADLGGISPTMRTVLTNTKARGFEELGGHIDFARDYERDFKPLGAAQASIEALSRRFDDLRDTAVELGLDISKVDEAFRRERAELTRNFDRDTAAGMLDRMVTGFRRLTDDAKARLDQARVLGADLTAVERQNFYEKRGLLLQLGEEERKILLGLLSLAEKAELAVVETLGKMGTATRKLEGALIGAIAASRQAAGSYRQLADNLRDTATSIRLSELSLLSTADKFAEIRRQYDDAKAAAAGGDQDAAQRLAGLARTTLEMGRQFYGAGPDYAALYQEVVGALGGTAAIQDGIAVRLDLHTVLLDAQLQVLKEIDRRLEKSQQASGVLDYLDLTLSRQGPLDAFDQVVARGEIDRLKELAATLPSAAKSVFDQILGGIETRLADDALTDPEAGDNKTDIGRLRLLFFEELQRQVGSDSDAVRAFELLRGAINDSAGASASLATRLRALGAVFGDLEDIFGGGQSPLADPAALQALVGTLADLVAGVGAIVPGEASGVLGALDDLIQSLPAAFDDVSRVDLGAVAGGLDAIGGAIESLGSTPEVTRLPGDLVDQESAFRSLGGYLNQAGLAPSIDALVTSFDALAGAGGGGALVALRGALAGLEAPTDALVEAIGAFDTAIAELIRTIREGDGLGGRRMPEIDKAGLAGSPVAQFDTLAGRVGSFVQRGLSAGFGEAELKASASWSWAVDERDRIIRSLAVGGDAETLLDRYYGGQRQIDAAAADQGANNLIRRLGELRGSIEPPAQPLAPQVWRFLEANQVWEHDNGWRVIFPQLAEARDLISANRSSLPWFDRYMAWWDAGHVVADLDRFARGGIVGSPVLFAHGGGRLGLMGEAGPEAILPLRRGRDGSLGIAANSNGAVDPRLVADLVAELKALRAEVADLRRQQAGEHRETMGQGALVAHRLGGRRAAAGGRG